MIQLNYLKICLIQVFKVNVLGSRAAITLLRLQLRADGRSSFAYDQKQLCGALWTPVKHVVTDMCLCALWLLRLK